MKVAIINQTNTFRVLTRVVCTWESTVWHRKWTPKATKIHHINLLLAKWKGSMRNKNTHSHTQREELWLSKDWKAVNVPNDTLKGITESWKVKGEMKGCCLTMRHRYKYMPSYVNIKGFPIKIISIEINRNKSWYQEGNFFLLLCLDWNNGEILTIDFNRVSESQWISNLC